MWQVGDEPVPGYRLEAFLGKGSNAEVWRASGPGRTAAALKLINLGGKLGLKELRGIQRVKEIRHAHLLPIMAFWLLGQQGRVLDDDALEALDQQAHGRHREVRGTLRVDVDWPRTLVVAMLLGEKNLRERLGEHHRAGRAGIPPDELLDYVEDAAKGIDYLNSPCHDLGSGPVAVQHCDIKPQNILLVGNSAMVCDFGLARVFGGSDVYRTITGPAGTPAYIAPECIRHATPSSASDQYSLAITYVELRTGRLPFKSESLNDIYEAHTRGKLELGGLSESEAAVIRRATSLEPQGRYPSTLEMVRQLRRAVAEQGPLAPAAGQDVAAPVAEDVSSAVTINPYVTDTPSCLDAGTVSPGGQGRGDAGGGLAVTVPPGSESPLAAGPPADGLDRPQPHRCVLHFQPKSARVTINGVRHRLDAEGRVEVQGYLDTLLTISATAPEYEPYQETLAIAQLELQTCRIELRHDARALVRRGISYLKKGDVEAAIADFDEAIERSPDLTEAYYARAMAHGATVEYRRDCAAAFNERAHTHFAQGDYRRAAADFTEAMRLDPELAKADRCRLLRNRAVAYRSQGLHDQAIADYTTVIRRNPEFAKPYHDRAAAHLEKGDCDQAIRDYAEAVRLTPADAEEDYSQDLASAHRARGDARCQKGQYDKALADYAEAIRLRPDWGTVYNQRGRAQAARGNVAGAIADYSRAIELDSQFAHLYLYNRGSVYLKNGDYPAAVADFTAAIQQQPDYGKAYRCRSQAYEKLGMEAEAAADAAKADSLE